MDLNALSKQQKWLIYLIVEKNFTREQVRNEWCRHFQRNLTIQALQNAIYRIAFSEFWVQSMHGGNSNYLNTQDMKTLASDVYEMARLDRAYDTCSILEAARVLKVNRTKLAKHALIILKSEERAANLNSEDIKEPCRTWINSILSKINAKAFYPVFIDSKRFLSCTVEIIQNYFNTFYALFSQTPPELFFTSDESMIDIKKHKKVILPNSQNISLQKELENMPHITGMFCNNLYGAKPPIFIIIKCLKHCPNELQFLVRSGFIWLASSANGWMDRLTFLMWTICFIGWLQQYREGFPHLRNRRALLLVDGHSSRENPLAIELFNAFNVDVVVLPAHTTHILQLFDIILASPFKNELSKIIQTKMRDQSSFDGMSNAASLRHISITSVVESWNRVCTTKNCLLGARKAGLLPCGSHEPLQSKYVRELSEFEQQQVNMRANANANRININCSMLNNRIDEIRDKLASSGTCGFCRKKLETFASMEAFVRETFRHASTTSLMLGAVQQFSGFNLINCV